MLLAFNLSFSFFDCCFKLQTSSHFFLLSLYLFTDGPSSQFCKCLDFMIKWLILKLRKPYCTYSFFDNWNEFRISRFYVTEHNKLGIPIVSVQFFIFCSEMFKNETKSVIPVVIVKQLVQTCEYAALRLRTTYFSPSLNCTNTCFSHYCLNLAVVNFRI